MKIFNIVFVIIFILFAAVQYNDPDPYVWMIIYLYAAFLCFRAVQRKYNRVLYFTGLAGYVSYGAWLLFDKTGVLNWAREHHSENIVQTMHATKPWIEETREFFGLVIVIVVLLINMFWLSKRNSNNKLGNL
ncbi:MAG: transmembrane 220 family protein [Ginsengibacter sp.]